MVYESPYKVGDIVEIYDDWETRSLLVGMARLIKKHKSGLPFILSDAKERQQVIFNHEEWYVEWLDCIGKNKKRVKLRYVESIGLPPAQTEKEPTYKSDKIIDSFITVNGIEVF